MGAGIGLVRLLVLPQCALFCRERCSRRRRMPIYEYRCKSCGKVFEVIQQFGAPQLRTCRECKGRLEKLISKSAFHLKGGGWYDQGYAKSGAGSGTKSSENSTKSSETSTKSSDSSTKPSKKKSESKGSGSKPA